MSDDTARCTTPTLFEAALKHDRTSSEAIDVLRDLMNNPHIDLDALVYDVREREGLGWDGPCVKAASDAVARAKKLIGK